MKAGSDNGVFYILIQTDEDATKYNLDGYSFRDSYGNGSILMLKSWRIYD